VPADDRPGASVSRRHLLLAASAGAAAGLAACGSSAHRQPPNPEPRAADADVLYALLGVAEQAVVVYARVAAVLTGPERDLARRIGVQEAAHVYALSGGIYRLGGDAAPQHAAHPVSVGDRAGALLMAAQTEDMSIAACLDALPKLADLEARALAASIAGCDAQHALLVGQARGVSPFATAVVSGRG
jgi:hypothetical protein